MANGYPLKTTWVDGDTLPAADLNDLAASVNQLYIAILMESI